MNQMHVSLNSMMPLMQEALASGKTVQFSPRGISMEPMLRQERDSVTLSPIPGKLKKYDLPLYRRDNGTYVLHRVIRAGDDYTCIGDNQFVKEPGIRQDQLIGLVRSFTHKGKTYSVSHAGYRIYCRVWHYTRFPRHVLRYVSVRLRRLIKK